MPRRRLALAVKVCIGCRDPGGPDSVIVDSLELSEILDFYGLHEDGWFEHTSQTRKCLGGCSDLVESIIRRDVEKVAVLTLTPNSLFRLSRAGVKVYQVENPSVRATLEMLERSELKEIGMDQYSRLAKR